MKDKTTDLLIKKEPDRIHPTVLRDQRVIWARALKTIIEANGNVPQAVIIRLQISETDIPIQIRIDDPQKLEMVITSLKELKAMVWPGSISPIITL